MKPVTLVILDGFGCAPPGPGNAVRLAETPVFDRLWADCPHTTIEASGEAAGLPPGQMGNSEVGHLTIGSGRRLYQDLMRVNRAVEDGTLFDNPVLRAAFEHEQVHLLGLVSHGGVHSHIEHLQALLRFAPEKTWIHAITDGRDVSPTSSVRDLAELPVDRIATVMGRYWAMDRDKRWDRTKRAFDAITRPDRASHAADPIAAVRASYDAGITDEFIEPVAIDGTPRIEPGDAVIFFNFRPDRGRQLTQMLLNHGFDIDVTTMTRYASDLETHVVFEEQHIENTLAQVLSGHGLTQLHVAETEKYAHVTYFFNGGREEPWPGEERELVPSPRDVPSYDHKPEMSADEVAERVVERVGEGFAFCVVNFANPDMVGHTGSIPAVIAACETADRCLDRVVERVDELGGSCLVTADHGNAEQMLEPDGISPHTAHTTNPVPLLLTGSDASLADRGEIGDLAPTILALLGLPQPAEMTGRSLLSRLHESAA
jgi:2,3-bisphosphoglycerate-independent phosphoglycerate mutase